MCNFGMPGQSSIQGKTVGEGYWLLYRSHQT